MALDQSMGRYFRLQQELATACRAQPRHDRRIDRLAIDLAGAAREIECAASARATAGPVGEPPNAIDGRQAQAQLVKSESL
jgi:hypothetical protein